MSASGPSGPLDFATHNIYICEETRKIMSHKEFFLYVILNWEG